MANPLCICKNLKRTIYEYSGRQDTGKKSQSMVYTVSQKQSGGVSIFQFVNNRSEAFAQRKLQEMANNSSQVKQTAQLQAMVEAHSAHHQQAVPKKRK